MNNPFLPPTASAPLPSSFPLPPSPQPSVLVVELAKEELSNELPPSPPASEPSPLQGSTPIPSSTINTMNPTLDVPPSPSKMALPPSPPESPTLLEQDPMESDPTTSTSIHPPPSSSTDETVASPIQLTPTAIESTPLLSPIQQREIPAVSSAPVLANNSQSVQLPSHATDSLLLSSTSKPTLHKKKSFLGIGIKRDRSVSAPATESSSSKPAVKEAVVKKKSSLMGGLLRSLTGKSGTKKAKTSSEQAGLLTRGLSVIEDRSEKARLEKEELKQEELANEQKIKNHVATLLVPASTRPLSGSAPSPTRPLRASSSSPARKGGAHSTDVGALEHPGINASETSRTVSGGPNQRLRSSSPQRAPPPRQYYQQQQPQFKPTSPPSNKPKLNVSVPTYTPPSATSPRAIGSNPIPIQQNPSSNKPKPTYARNSSGSSSGSESDSDDDDVGLTIKKKKPVELQVERNEEEEVEADEDGKLSSLGHGNSPVTPGLPATPPDSAISQEQGAAGFGSFFGSVRGRKSGGGRPPTMLFGKASTSPQFNQQHYNNQQQQQYHYQSYNQKQENRQSRIPVSPVMHTAADVAAKIQAAEGEDQKNAEAFFM